mgnify:CR=1 FL=1
MKYYLKIQKKFHNSYIIEIFQQKIQSKLEKQKTLEKHNEK